MKSFIKICISMLCIGVIITGCAGLENKNKNQTEVEKKESIENEQNIKLVKQNLNLIMVEDCSKVFNSDDNWFCYNAAINFENNNGSLKSEDNEISEAWYKYEKSFPSTKDFMVSADIKVPKFWDTYKKKDAQVGIGVFVGKKGNEGKMVYESDLCAISNKVRFVQGQMIKNRKGGEPVEVDFKEIKDESGTISILYSKENSTLSLLFNDTVIGTQKIDSTGAVNWNMTQNDEFVIGIIGFSEWTNIANNFPSITNIKVSE